MRGRLQRDPEEVWIFGFGSIIYKQGKGSNAVQGRHTVSELPVNGTLVLRMQALIISDE
jgi:cation transport regulator ChaC